jgi:hypothetical protein
VLIERSLKNGVLALVLHTAVKPALGTKQQRASEMLALTRRYGCAKH